MLRKYLNIDSKRAFLNWKFPVSIVMICILLFYNKNEPSDVVSWVCSVNQLQFILIAMAVASVPYVASCVDETCHKFKIQMILRGNDPNYYIISKMCTVFVSTVVTFFGGFSMALVIHYFRLGMPDQETIHEILELKVAYGTLLQKNHFVFYFIVCNLHLSVLSGFMALIGLLIIQFVNNRIAAYSFPLLFVYIQDVLAQRIMGWERGCVISLKCMGINQLEMILPGQCVESYFFQILCYSVITCYFIDYVSKRKLNE